MKPMKPLKLFSRSAGRLLLALACTVMPWSFPAHAASDDTLWRCGGVLTDVPPENSRRSCVAVPDGSAIRTDIRSSKISMPTVRRENPLPVTAVQSVRDRESREILENELAAAIAKRNALREKTVVSPSSRKPVIASDDTASLARTQELNRANTDIESLQRELARLPADTRSAGR